MKTFSMLLAATVAIKFTLLGMANYTPVGDEAVKFLKDTKDMWSCPKDTTPTVARRGTGLGVECIPIVMKGGV